MLVLYEHALSEKKESQTIGENTVTIVNYASQLVLLAVAQQVLTITLQKSIISTLVVISRVIHKQQTYFFDQKTHDLINL